MLKIIYTKDGIDINDFKAYEFVDNYINSCIDKIYDNDISIKISSELCLHVFILRILENNISIDNVEFYFEDEKLEFDPCLGLMEPKNGTTVMGFYYEVTNKILHILYANIKKSRMESK